MTGNDRRVSRGISLLVGSSDGEFQGVLSEQSIVTSFKFIYSKRPISILTFIFVVFNNTSF